VNKKEEINGTDRDNNNIKIIPLELMATPIFNILYHVAGNR
jgi:hypothetical protein